MDQYRSIFKNPPKGGTERSGVTTDNAMDNAPAAVPALTSRFAAAAEGAQMSRVSLDGPTNPPNTASERDVRNYTRGRLVPQNITHVRVGDTAYEAQKTRDLHAEVVAPRPSDPGPVGMPVPTDAPPDARYRSDGKPFPGSEKAAPPLPEDAPRGAGMGGSVAINGR